MPYILKLVLGSLYKEKWINLLSSLTIATGLFLMATAVFLVYNLEIATRKLPERFSMTIFLKDDLPEENINNVINAIKGHKSVKNLKYISKEDAFTELRSIIKDADYILEGLEENPLPPSLEISLKKEAVSEASVRAIASDLKNIEGVGDVDYGEKFLSSIQTIKSGAEAMGMLIIAALSAGIVFVCYSTVKVLFYRRKDEIETLQLLGASKGFIRTPLIIEGAVIGVAGGIAALIGVVLLGYFFVSRLTAYIPMLGSLTIPPEVLFYLPLTGILIGTLGAVIAIGRIRF